MSSHKEARIVSATSISYDPSTAFVVVDVQNDFADPAGNLYVPGGEQVVPLINNETHRATAAGAAVVYTQDWHPPTTPHFEKDGGVWPVHCVQDTWGAELHPELRVLGERVRKGTGGEDGYSGFSVRDPESGREDSTGLEDILRQRGVKTVVVTGLATDYCVKETALDAARKGFVTIVLRDGVRGVNVQPGDDERALARMRKAGIEIL
jgi:nicotinamidase/pyrazinamidase